MTRAQQQHEQLHERVTRHLAVIYQNILTEDQQAQLTEELLSLFRIDKCKQPEPSDPSLWDQRDTVLITYGDSVEQPQDKQPEEPPLKTLHQFLQTHVSDFINSVHILPFFPYSSDDGFAVIDYSTVNEALGSWEDIKAIASDMRLMSDVVINHCSARSVWFENFENCRSPGQDFFYTCPPDTDLSMVTRPRTSPLLRETVTSAGTQYVWCTFSHDQVDFDFRNPEVLKAFATIMRLYLDMGVRIFRLDAVAFLWKQPGTSSINLPQTHEVIKLLRTLTEVAETSSVIITETNIPNRENLTYFGNANEAHAIYNFSLPPLLINTLLTGNCFHLKSWMMSMPPAQDNTCYFNFIASHDGIGLRPAEGLLDEAELVNLIRTLESFGGRVSYRTLADNQQHPYEVNIALFDALQGTIDGPDGLGIDRFVCAHAVMLGLEGIPGIYIHSLLGTRNDYARMEHTGHNRSINRHRWQYQQLTNALSQPDSHHHKVYHQLKALIEIRTRQKAFHPNATQFTLHLGTALFGFWRQSIDRKQSIFCISNVQSSPTELRLADVNLIDTCQWTDLISGQSLLSCQEVLNLAPYQTVWLSNLDGATEQND